MVKEGVFAFLICNFSLAVTGCALPHVPSRVVYEDPINFVRLESDANVLPEWPPSAHSHPLIISADEIAGILQGLQVREHRIGVQVMLAGEAAWEPAFRQDEIALLADAQLVGAQPEPNQRQKAKQSPEMPKTAVPTHDLSLWVKIRALRHLPDAVEQVGQSASGRIGVGNVTAVSDEGIEQGPVHQIG